MGAAAEPKLNYRGKFVVRCLGTIFTIACVSLIVAGETFLKDELRGPQFVLYWTWCFLSTLLAGLTAILDLILVRRAGKQSRRELLHQEFTGKS